MWLIQNAKYLVSRQIIRIEYEWAEYMTLLSSIDNSVLLIHVGIEHFSCCEKLHHSRFVFIIKDVILGKLIWKIKADEDLAESWTSYL